jgi:hypothetical protein
VVTVTAFGSNLDAKYARRLPVFVPEGYVESVVEKSKTASLRKVLGPIPKWSF